MKAQINTEAAAKYGELFTKWLLETGMIVEQQQNKKAWKVVRIPVVAYDAMRELQAEGVNLSLGELVNRAVDVYVAAVKNQQIKGK